MLAFARVLDTVYVGREPIAESSQFVTLSLNQGDDLLFRLQVTCFFQNLLPFEQINYAISPLFFCILKVGVLATEPIQMQLVGVGRNGLCFAVVGGALAFRAGTRLASGLIGTLGDTLVFLGLLVEPIPKAPRFTYALP
jgi:hypothetical protein